MYSKHKTGQTSELRAQLYFALNGYEVYTSTYGQGSVDFVTIKDGITQRIQVKSAYWMSRTSGQKYLQATTRRGCGKSKEDTYTKKDCDLMVIVHEDALWIIPVEFLNEDKNIILDKECKKPRKSYAKDYRQFKVS